MKNLNFNGSPTFIFKKEINKYFQNYIKNRYDVLDHFAINIITKDSNSFSLCSNSEYISNYQKHGISKYEKALSPWECEGMPVIPWRLISNISNKEADRLNQLVTFKEMVHNLFSGISFIFKTDNIYINVAVATYNPNPSIALRFLENADDILNIGAFFYGLFHNKLEELSEVILPKIDEIVLLDSHYEELYRLSKQWNDMKIFTPPKLITTI